MLEFIRLLMLLCFVVIVNLSYKRASQSLNSLDGEKFGPLAHIPPRWEIFPSRFYCRISFTASNLSFQQQERRTPGVLNQWSHWDSSAGFIGVCGGVFDLPLAQELLVTSARIKEAGRSARGRRKKRETGGRSANKTSSTTIKSVTCSHPVLFEKTFRVATTTRTTTVKTAQWPTHRQKQKTTC